MDSAFKIISTHGGPAMRYLLRRSLATAASSGPNCERIAKGLVVGMYEKEVPHDKPTLTKGAYRFDDSHGGHLMHLVVNSDHLGRLGESKTYTNMGSEVAAVSVVGLGPQNSGMCQLESIDVARENVRYAAGVGSKILEDKGCTHILVDGMEFPEQAAEGSTLALWKYQENVHSEKQKYSPPLDIYNPEDKLGWATGVVKAECQNTARRLSEMPANQCTPSIFAQQVVDLLCPLGVNVEVRNINWIEHNSMNCFLTVSKSSCEPPIMLELIYCGGGSSDDKPILLVGEGQTFNTGGLCLKKPEGMQEYRASMTGAACVVGAIQAAAALQMKSKVVGLIPLCENMTSGMAVRPGDVITSKTGKTIVVHDSNESGMLMLIDALIYGQGLFLPKLTIDVATSTEDIKNALGGAATGVFTDAAYLWSDIEKAGMVTGDRMWRMPLWNYFTEKVTSYEKYDTTNKGRGSAQACKTAACLREFVTGCDWMHLDIRGVGMWCNNKVFPYYDEGYMTGRPTRTLIEFLCQAAGKK